MLTFDTTIQVSRYKAEKFKKMQKNNNENL
jgi:hypothetical protein